MARSLRHRLLPALLLLSLLPLHGCDNSDTTVVVVGAGVSGLTAAWYLQQEGYQVVVLEKEDQAGGRTVSGERDGFVYARGTEYLGKPEDHLAELIDVLALTPVEIPAPMDAHWHGGKLYWGDDGLALLLIEGSSLETYNRFVSTLQALNQGYEDPPDLDLNGELAPLDDISARDWLEEKGFGAIYQEVYNVASRGLFGASLDEISALSYIPELAFDFEGNEPLSSVSELENDPSPSEPTESYSFVTGITEVTEALAGAVGSALHLKSTVESVVRVGEGYEVRYADGDGVSHTLSADGVILAVPAPVAVKLGAEVLSADQKSLLSQIQFSSYATVALFSDEPIFTQAFDLAVPDGLFFTDVYDATWVQRAYDPAVKNVSSYINAIYIAGQTSQDMAPWSLSSEALVEKALEDLETIIPGATDKVLETSIQRFEYAYPVLNLGAYHRLKSLHDMTSGSLALAGDSMTYPTFEAAVEAGYRAAENIWDAI